MEDRMATIERHAAGVFAGIGFVVTFVLGAIFG
jgi:hypothetical protein